MCQKKNNCGEKKVLNILHVVIKFIVPFLNVDNKN